MHYKCLLFTKEFPTQEKISEILKPFSSEGLYSDDGEHSSVYPAFTWDWWQVGGRYNGCLKLRCDQENDDKYRWEYLSRDNRNGRLFWSYLLTKMKEFAKGSFMYTEEDYYPAMGSRDGYINVDSAYIPDLLNFEGIESYCCLDKDGIAYSRSSWNGDTWVEDPDFDLNLAKVKKESSDCFVTVIDLHD